MDAERAINMAKQLNIPFIGVVKMSGFICPHCNNKIDLFGHGGGEKLAKENNVQFLGSIPIDIDARILSDSGHPIVLEKPQTEIAISLRSIAKYIEFANKKELV